MQPVGVELRDEDGVLDDALIMEVCALWDDQRDRPRCVRIGQMHLVNEKLVNLQVTERCADGVACVARNGESSARLLMVIMHARKVRLGYDQLYRHGIELPGRERWMRRRPR